MMNGIRLVGLSVVGIFLLSGCGGRLGLNCDVSYDVDRSVENGDEESVNL